jgi:hypothetical protein
MFVERFQLEGFDNVQFFLIWFLFLVRFSGKTFFWGGLASTQLARRAQPAPAQVQVH